MCINRKECVSRQGTFERRGLWRETVLPADSERGRRGNHSTPVTAPETRLREAGEAWGARCSLSAPRDDSGCPSLQRPGGGGVGTHRLPAAAAPAGVGVGVGGVCLRVLSGGQACDSQRLCRPQAQVSAQALGLRGGQVGQRGPGLQVTSRVASKKGLALTPGRAGSEGLTGPAPPHARHGT